MPKLPRFVWIDEMEKEYRIVKKTMIEQIHLKPYNPDKSLRLIIDGASTEAIDFVLF